MQDKKLIPEEVFLKTRRLRLTGTFFARRHRVSKSYVSKAFLGKRGTASILSKIDNSCDVISQQRIERASKTLRSISHKDTQS